LLDALLRWALKECPIRAEIYEKCAFLRFRWLRVEIIGDFFYEKVIHRSLIDPTSTTCDVAISIGIPPSWRDSGCPDKYLKTY
jgi:hypothetical protein